jgi:hypothetical protein
VACCRGLLTPDTEIYFLTAAQQATSSTDLQWGQQQHSASNGAAETAQQLGNLSLQQQQPDSATDSTQPDQAQGINASMNGGHEHAHPPVQSRLAAGGSCVQLEQARQRPPAAAPTNIVNVYSSDGEWFPVKKKLLRPCIALTKVLIVPHTHTHAPCPPP